MPGRIFLFWSFVISFQIRISQFRFRNDFDDLDLFNRFFGFVGMAVFDHHFDYAGNHASRVAGYGQAWALTHFLMERHFDEFIAFYRRLGEMPPEVHFSQEVLTSVFNECVKRNRRSLDSEWRTYMRGLKTDLEIILDGN